MGTYTVKLKLVISKHHLPFNTCIYCILHAICKSAQFAKSAVQFQNCMHPVCKFITNLTLI